MIEYLTAHRLLLFRSASQLLTTRPLSYISTYIGFFMVHSRKCLSKREKVIYPMGKNNLIFNH